MIALIVIQNKFNFKDYAIPQIPRHGFLTHGLFHCKIRNRINLEVNNNYYLTSHKLNSTQLQQGLLEPNLFPWIHVKHPSSLPIFLIDAFSILLTASSMLRLFNL